MELETLALKVVLKFWGSRRGSWLILLYNFVNQEKNLNYPGQLSKWEFRNECFSVELLMNWQL